MAHQPALPHLPCASAAVRHQNHHRTAQGKSSHLLVLLVCLINHVLRFAKWPCGQHAECHKFAACQSQCFLLSPGSFGIACIIQYCSQCAIQPGWKQRLHSHIAVPVQHNDPQCHVDDNDDHDSYTSQAALQTAPHVAPCVQPLPMLLLSISLHF